MINIVSDSCCDLKSADVAAEGVRFSTVPFSLRIGDREFVDEETMDPLEMVEAMEKSAEASTSACPAPGVWAEEFEKGDETFAITISANLSGSHASAAAAKDMVEDEYPDKKITVLDCEATGPVHAMCVRLICDLAEKGFSYEEIAEKAKRFCRESKTIFALSSFDNLVKNGRVSKFAGLVATKLKLWGIGIEEGGRISVKGVSRGVVSVIKTIIEDMKNRGFSGKLVTISHCFNVEFAERLKGRIIETWPQAAVTILKTRGLDSFYAERNGIIVGYI